MASAPRFSEVHRSHAADAVFEQIAAAILRRELAAGESLPAERLLAERFGVSRIIVRQAVHRLAEHGLVRVRQGGATQVLDPDAAADIRLIGLYYRLDLGAKARRDVERDVIEKQFLQGLALIDIADRRASEEERASLVELAASFDERSGTDAQFRAFEERFWRAAAKAGKNRILKMEVAWWYQALDRPPREPQTSAAPMAARIGFYRELARKLATHDKPSAYYLEVVSVILRELFAEPAKKPGKRR